MKIKSKLLPACFALVLLAFASPSRAETEKRIAFVVGNAAYQAGPLATPANDAGVIAQTLQAAGFDVTGARDLDGESMRAAFRDFLDKAQASGPDTVAFVYLAGYGLQFEGENYFVPVDAKIVSAQDVEVEALRVSDYTKRLAGLPLKASFVPSTRREFRLSPSRVRLWPADWRSLRPSRTCSWLSMRRQARSRPLKAGPMAPMHGRLPK